MGRKPRTGGTQFKMLAGVRPFVDLIGAAAEAQPLPAAAIRETDGTFRVSTLVETALMKMRRDLLQGVKISVQQWHLYHQAYLEARAKRENEPDINTYMSEASLDAMDDIAEYMREQRIMVEEINWKDGINRRRVTLIALAYTVDAIKAMQKQGG